MVDDNPDAEHAKYEEARRLLDGINSGTVQAGPQVVDAALAVANAHDAKYPDYVAGRGTTTATPNSPPSTNFPAQNVPPPSPVAPPVAAPNAPAVAPPVENAPPVVASKEEAPKELPKPVVKAVGKAVAKETAYSGLELQNADEQGISPEEKQKRLTHNEEARSKVYDLVNTPGGIDALQKSDTWLKLKPKDREALQTALLNKSQQDDQAKDMHDLQLDQETSNRLAAASAPERDKINQQISEREGHRRALWEANQQYMKDVEAYKNFKLDGEDKYWKEASTGEKILAVIVGGLGGGFNPLINKGRAYVEHQMYYFKKYGEGLDKQKAGIDQGNALENDTQTSQSADWFAKRQMYGVVIDKLTGAMNLATDPVKKANAEQAIAKLKLDQEDATRKYKETVIESASKRADAKRLAMAQASAGAYALNQKREKEALEKYTTLISGDRPMNAESARQIVAQAYPDTHFNGQRAAQIAGGVSYTEKPDAAKTNEQGEKLSKELAPLEDVKTLLATEPKGFAENVPGYTTSHLLASEAGKDGGLFSSTNAGLNRKTGELIAGKEGIDAENWWTKLKMAVLRAGVGRVTDTELSTYDNVMRNGSPAEKQRVLDEIKANMANADANIKSGYDPNVVALNQSRKEKLLAEGRANNPEQQGFSPGFGR